MNPQSESRSPPLCETLPTRSLNFDCSNLAVTDIVRVFVIVEGTNDIKFLKRISAILHTSNSALPHLSRWEQQGKLIFVPTGGDLLSWSDRLAPLGVPEFHLCDRELAPETELRRKVVESVNARPGCRAVLTNKRSIENYLHPRALLDAGWQKLNIRDFDSVPEQVARQRFGASEPDISWECLDGVQGNDEFLRRGTQSTYARTSDESRGGSRYAIRATVSTACAPPEADRQIGVWCITQALTWTCNRNVKRSRNRQPI